MSQREARIWICIGIGIIIIETICAIVAIRAAILR